MNEIKLQTASSKLQGNTKFQTSWRRPGSLNLLKLDVWSFTGAWCLVFGALLFLSVSAFAAQPSVSLSGMPLFFEPQESAIGGPSTFLARGQNYQFAITATGAQIVLSKAESDQADLFTRTSRITRRASRSVQMQLLGSNPYASIHSDGLLSGKINYLVGNDASQWRTDMPVFSKVQVNDVYPGINLIYYGSQDQLEYDFVIAPHAKPETIALHFDEVDKIEISREGELVLSLGEDEIRFHRPVLYQDVHGTQQPISGGYQLEDSRTVTFSVGNYDHDLPLIIDPVLTYSTYFGGNFGDTASGVKVHTNGFIYIAGATLSRKWPFTNFFGADTNFNGGRFNGDAFVAKLSNDASNLIYFTYIGGTNDDGALDLALDRSGNPYITGFTDSPDFPTTNAAFPTIHGILEPKFHTFPTDAFVAELNSTDGSLIFSTYLGGSDADVAGAITVDNQTNVYVTGYTYSTNFQTSSTVFTNTTLIGYTNGLSGSNDIFVAKFAPNVEGMGLAYITLFGGTGLDTGEGIAADDSNHVYVCGYTGSTNLFTTTNALPGTNGLGFRHINGVTNDVKVYKGVRKIPFDGFLAKFDTTIPGTDSVKYSTYFGGKQNDAAFRMVLCTNNTDVIITGNTRSPDFPTNNFHAQPRVSANANNSDAFLIRFTFATNPPAIYYSTVFGGSSDDLGWDLALDPSGNVYVVGITLSANFPTTNGAPLLHTNHIGARDVFVTAFSGDASNMLYSVQLGGSGQDYGYGIAADASNSVYIVGRTFSGNFPVTNVSTLFRTKRYGTNDAFLAKISTNAPSAALLTLQADDTPVAPPPMFISIVSGNTIRLAWPDSASGYVLESNTNLASAYGWVPVGLPVRTTNGTQQVEIPATNSSLFFRLRR